MDLRSLLDYSLLGKIAASLALLVAVLVLRAVLAQVIQRQKGPSEMRRRWIVTGRNWLFVLFLLGLGAIWADALRSFALSIVAVAVAAVIATKELIQCFTGSILRTFSQAYSVGDRIELGGHRGDVVDLNMLTTTILEVGPGRTTHIRTGRMIVIPNARVTDSVVINESYMEGYVLHVFSVPVKAEDDWQEARRILQEAASEQAQPYMPIVRQRVDTLERKHSLSGPPIEPSIFVQVPEAGIINLVVRIPAPVGRQGYTEQVILRKFLKEFRPAKPKTQPS